jgi:hypothetical protein
MARDLIPPPSPAGRPEPDSSGKRAREQGPAGPERGLWSGGDEPRTPLERGAGIAAVAAPDEPAPAVLAPYRPRFGFVLGALIGVALAAGALALAVVLQAADDGVPAGWSAWRPSTKDDLGAAKQIAEHVGPKYRLGDGDQLVAVQSGGLQIADLPLDVAMRTSANGGDIKLIQGNGVMYTLNGLGPRGSIPDGKPSEERHLLLRREALELALYTFRYAKGVDMVVALLPPPPPEKGATAAATAQVPTQALFYRPGDLKGELDVPLQATIAPRTPRPETMSLSGSEGRKINALTRSNLFEASFQQGQDAHAFLVLDRPSG